MTTTGRRATVSYSADGAGGRIISLNLTLFQFAIGLILQIAATIGLGWGVATYVGQAQMREWWRVEGLPSVKEYVAQQSTMILAQTDATMVKRIDEKIKSLETLLAQTNSTANTNAAILLRIESDLRELRARTDTQTRK